MPDISIIIPHKPGLNNDKALRLAINSILAYTEYSYELILDMTVPGDPYTIWNEASEQARGKTLIFSNSDVVFAPGWDILALFAVPNTIVTGYIMEPGNIGVAPVNITANYGKHPDEFNESAFHSHAAKHKAPEIDHKRAWYMPCAMNRDWFLSTGKFPAEIPFPEPNDIKFWDYCVNKLGTSLVRVKSFSYHFQNQSGRE